MIINLEAFKDKKVIVTGSSTGIGFHTALEFLELGANVVFHGNSSTQGLEKKISSINSNYNFKVIKSDFTKLKNVNYFMDEAIDYLNGLDILINNAGTMIGRYSLDKISENEFLKIFSAPIC